MSAGAKPDPLALAQDLIRCASVTPVEGGALDLLEAQLGALGFVCHRLPFSEDGTPDVDNLYARFGDGQPNFCFAGHTDVVPVGDDGAWSVDPFAGTIRDDRLWGRGASDMKGAIAAFVAAAAAFLDDRGDAFDGSISLLITGDEEGPAINGTVKVLDWMAEAGQHIDHCLVGEPTNPEELGEMVKIGRRGSLTGKLTVRGIQGHVAYPHLSDNPAPRLIKVLDALNDRELDPGTAHFQPSNLEITTIDIGNPATNVIPGQATAVFNIRFNTAHTPNGLKDWIRSVCDTHGGDYELSFVPGGSEPFLTEESGFTRIVAGAIERICGRPPQLSTTGGTSDARFIKNVCPVVEFGLIGRTMHQIDEHVGTGDVRNLSRIYRHILDDYFAAAP